MSKSVKIYNALCLPAPDVEALIQGRMIAAMPRKLLNTGQKFALYPTSVSTNLLPNEEQYQSNFLPFVQKVINNISVEKAAIKAWARCEWCELLDKSKKIDSVSCLTIWTTQALEEILAQRPYIFLAYLRVYLLSEHLEMVLKYQNSQFVDLPNSLTVTEDNPILNDHTFAQRRKQLENLEPPQHPELEELQSILSQFAITNPAAKELDDDIQIFLGWRNTKQIQPINTNLDWINEIAKLGDRSIELDEKKSNYQAGTDFENITRQSLEYLGFKVEDAYKGGAGGLDLFCSQPYPLVCECKAGKLIPSRTIEELLKLGGMHLGKTQLLNSAKLVIGPGNPSTDTLKAAKEWEVSIINAMTLQKLVELKAKYPGAINLFELQEYLKPGQIDTKLDEYIDKTEQQIKLRSHIIQVVKNYLEATKYERAGVESLHAVYVTSHPPQPLESRELHEILIELSSPLTGYLGRIKGSDWRSDRFYYLRDLLIN